MLLFVCPGCDEVHGIRVEGEKVWDWNKSFTEPTFSPSIKVTQTLYGPDKLPFRQYKGGYPCQATEAVCHSFVKDGKIQFLDDCYHELAGQTVELPDWHTAFS
jgi:hypothetical protein